MFFVNFYIPSSILQDDVCVVFSKKIKQTSQQNYAKCVGRYETASFWTKREEGHGEVVQELSIVSEGRCFVRLWFSLYCLLHQNNATNKVHGLVAHKYIYYF